MRNYENLIIFDPDIDEETREKRVEIVKTLIEKEGKVLNIDRWGVREFTFLINKKQKGYYMLIEFSANEKVLPELNRELKLSQEVMRHSIIRKGE
ncbi:MAG: 30S ribosomal protein S6 [Candidatus Stahlbacteria bacterium]|nr:30S ribosomal protein S6 [Candidatus Stahlbacteria bacterium]